MKDGVYDLFNLEEGQGLPASSYEALHSLWEIVRHSH